MNSSNTQRVRPKNLRTIGSKFVVGFVWASAMVFLPTSTPALPPSFVSDTVGDDWNQAVGLIFAPDGRMFVWEKAGRVWNVENGVKALQPLIDISAEVGDWRDYGLLGFAIDPNFYSNGYIYLLYVVDYHFLTGVGSPDFFHDTIARLTRYTCNSADGFRSVDYASRFVLIGESLSTGFPICHQSHGIGSLVFGEDGTLMASCGDAASYEKVDTGGWTNGSSNTCLSDGIITAKEDVGAFRAQLVDSLNGKIIRIDPATGDGLPSNPFYDALAPRSARSRVWATGLRNPFRMTLRPATGNVDPAAGDPGTLYIGDVGWYSWEDLNVCKSAGVNFGWPSFEGLTPMWSYYSVDVENLDFPNPLYLTIPPGQGLCTQEYFFFNNLIIQDTLNPASFPNPCDPAQQIPGNVYRFEHTRPAIEWGHGGPARTGIFVGNDASEINIGDPASPVSGPQFGGNSSTGGIWYTASDFPIEYQNTYFHAEFGGRWIRNFVFDGNDDPVEIRDFAEEGSGEIVALATNPQGGGLYYIAYDQFGCCNVNRVSWVLNAPPIAAANANPIYGPEPLTVQFSSVGSVDPDASVPNDLTFEWDFGDGTPISREADPVHIYPTEDITMTGAFVGQIFLLNPPHPIGGGNWDPEIMRDGDWPPVGNQESSRQYDTYHAGDQGNVDWIGYTFSGPRELRALIFQEGKHFFDGGWFDSYQIQVRVSNVWLNVSGLIVTPTYSGVDDGESFETYVFRFSPVVADGVRIHGNPGGSAGFISVGELRVLAAPLAPVTNPTRYDVTLTVTDALGGSDTAMLSVYLNNSPPVVSITSPINGSTYSLDAPTILPLTADIFDSEHASNELTCQWQTILHHNDHTHPEPFDGNCTTQTVITPIGCDGETYFYETALTVSDPLGLATSASSFIFPDCNLCDADADCNDGNPCTDDTCDKGNCVNMNNTSPCDDGDRCTGNDACAGGVCNGAPVTILYGDVTGNGVIDVDDISCVLDGFTALEDCPLADLSPCPGNDVIDVDDIAAVLDAFAGAAACPDPCP